MAIGSLLAGLLAVMSVASASETADGPRLVAQVGHERTPYCLAFSPDGSLLATGGEDESLRLWDTATGRLIAAWDLSDSVQGVGFSPDGGTLAAGTIGSMHFLELTARGPIEPVSVDAEGATNALFSRDLSYALATHFDERELRVRRRDGSTGQVFSYKGVGVDIALDGAEDLVAVADARPDLPVFSMRRGRLVRRLKVPRTKGDANKVYSVAVSPDGERLVAATTEAWALFEPRSGVEIESSVDGVQIVDVAIASRGDVFAVSDKQGAVVARATSTGAERWSWRVEGVAPGRVRFTPDGSALAVGVAGAVTLLDARTGELIRTFEVLGAPLTDLSATRSGRLLISKKDQLPQEWDALGRTLRARGSSTGRYARSSPDGSHFAVSGEDTLSVFAGDSAAAVWERAALPGIPVFDDRGTVLVHRGADEHTVGILDVGTGAATTVRHASLEAWTVSPDGRWVATGADRGEVRIWDAASGAQVERFSGGEGTLLDLQFSPDGSLLAVGGILRKGLNLFDTSTWEAVAHLDEQGVASTLVFSADSKRLAVGLGWGKSIVVWDVAKRAVEVILPGHTKHTGPVVFLDDHRLASVGSDQTVRLWDIDGGAQIGRLWSKGDHWAVVGADGRFDGTQAALGYLHWVQGTDVLPLESFIDGFYTPSLAATLLTDGPVVAPTPVAAPSERLRLPPVVRFVTPLDRAQLGAETQHITVTLEVSARDDGVDEVRLFHNGKAVGHETRGLGVARKSDLYTFEVPLLSGRNELLATAYNRSRVESTPARVVIQREAAEAQARLFALAVGINTYKNTLYDLNYGRPDAEAFSALVRQKGAGIFREVDVQTLYDRAATREAIRSSLEDIAERASPEDAFVFFYAGHGVMTEPSLEVPSKYYLALSEVTRLYGDEAHLAQAGLSGLELQELAAAIPARKQLVVLDACQSAGAIDAFAVRGAAEEKAILQLARSAGLTVLASSGSEQYAAEVDTLGHGLFTYALLQGLRGAADGGTEPDDKITVRELDAYLNDRIPSLTTEHRGAAQYPNSFSRGQDFPLVVE